MVSRMARDKEAERSADVVRLDRAIDAMLDIIRASVPKSGDQETDDLNALVLGKSKTEAAKVLPALFARRSALLGLDVAPEKPKENEGDKPGSLADLEKRLAAVSKAS